MAVDLCYAVDHGARETSYSVRSGSWAIVRRYLRVDYRIAARNMKINVVSECSFDAEKQRTLYFELYNSHWVYYIIFQVPYEHCM
jgi:hypothetical protein